MIPISGNIPHASTQVITHFIYFQVPITYLSVILLLLPLDIMFRRLLSALVLAASVSSEPIPAETLRMTEVQLRYAVNQRKVVLDRLDALESSYYMNPMDPPHYITDKEVMSGCSGTLGLGCPVTFFKRHNLQTDNMELTVKYTANKLGDAFNPSSSEGTVQYAETDMTTTSTTESWTIGIKASGKSAWEMPVGATPVKPEAALEVSATWGKAWTTTVMASNTTTYTKPCPAYHYCRIEKWAIFATLKGQCLPTARMTECDREISPCGEKPQICSAVKDRSAMLCQGAPKSRCTVDTAIFEGDRPMTTVVFIAEPIGLLPASGNMARDLKKEVTVEFLDWP